MSDSGLEYQILNLIVRFSTSISDSRLIRFVTESDDMPSENVPQIMIEDVNLCGVKIVSYDGNFEQLSEFSDLLNKPGQKYHFQCMTMVV